MHPFLEKQLDRESSVYVTFPLAVFYIGIYSLTLSLQFNNSYENAYKI